MARTRLGATPVKPRIAIVGAGNLASALAVSLRRAGFVIDEVISREKATSFERARSLAKEVKSSAAKAKRAQLDANVVWFCVPDAAIAHAAASVKGLTDWRGKCALHSSGALTSDELSELRGRGASVASVHPMMTFVRRARPCLEGVPFAIEGDASAVRVARSVVKSLGGHAYCIRQEEKAAYHAWGTFVCPLLVALLVTGEHVAAAAGIKGKRARARTIPILQQTLENYRTFDGAGAFSGPIIRGDIETIERHLHVLRRLPLAKSVYLALAEAALSYLPGKNKITLKKRLQSAVRERHRH